MTRSQNCGWPLNPCEQSHAVSQFKKIVVLSYFFFLLGEEAASALATNVTAGMVDLSCALLLPAQPPAHSLYLQREEKEEEVC